MTRMHTKVRSYFRPYWGYLVLPALLLAISQGADPLLLVGLSTILMFYALFQVPLPCGEPVRAEGKFCRNNSRGLLRGCWIQAHKWSKFRTAVLRHDMREATRGLWTGANAQDRLQTLAAVATILSALSGFGAALLTTLLH